MLEDTATLTVRSSSVMDLGRMSKKHSRREKPGTINQSEMGSCPQHSTNVRTCQGTTSSSPTLRPGGFSYQLLQLPHLSFHLLIVSLPGVHFGCGEKGRVSAHVGAEEVTV